MALTNAQYDEIMRGYDKRQLHNKYIHDKRIEDAYRKAPRLREIDSEIASASVRQAYRLMDGDENALAALRLAIEDYKEERAALLSTLGYPLDRRYMQRLALSARNENLFYPNLATLPIILSLFTPVPIATIQDT